MPKSKPHPHPNPPPQAGEGAYDSARASARSGSESPCEANAKPKPIDALHDALVAADAAGMRRQRRIVESAQGARLTLEGRDYLAFCSNDYLGLANHPRLVDAAKQALDQYGVGAGASHLVCGHTALHHQLETELATFVGLPRALFFSSGYMANLAVLTTLADRGTEIFADRLNHASLNDAALLSRARLRRYRHLDLAYLESLLRESRAPNKLIVSDTVFSMDGDIAPLPELLKLAENYDAWLYLDDAHGFGVLGEQGRGALHQPSSPLTPHPSLIYMATLGKAAGVSGAFVAGAAELIETLIQRARPYIYTTATPPMLAAALRASVALIQSEGEARRSRLNAHIARLQNGYTGMAGKLWPSTTPIQPLLFGTPRAAMDAAGKLRERGIWVPAIRPPTVPEGQSRLRISLSAAHTAEDVETLLGALNGLG